MIEFDEEEYSPCDLSETTLQFILDFYGPEVKDRLLIPKSSINLSP